MNLVSKEKTKLMDCYPEIQRERIEKAGRGCFWEGNEHAGKEDVILYIGEDFCCSVKTMPSSQSRQAPRSTSHRNFRIVESTDLNLPRKPRCHLNLDELLS